MCLGGDGGIAVGDVVVVAEELGDWGFGICGARC